LGHFGLFDCKAAIASTQPPRSYADIRRKQDTM
jgi:hypothetical protein